MNYPAALLKGGAPIYSDKMRPLQNTPFCENLWIERNVLDSVRKCQALFLGAGELGNGGRAESAGIKPA